MVNPRLGEKVLDPACGTGGFLTSAIENIRKQDVKGVEDLKTLDKTIHGMELKPLPFMLCVTNLILHDIEVPNVDYSDSLNREYTTIGQKDRVDVILANPPFGASVTDGVETNFPQNFRTTESADLFLMLMVRYLKDGGRAGIVLPDGSLTGDGVKQRIREHLLENCNLHTILDMPGGTFLGAGVKTVVLFFEKGSPTRKVWFYQLNLKRNLGKTNPLNESDLADDAQYRIGVLYEKYLRDYNKAVAAYRLVISNYSNSNYNVSAQDAIFRIQDRHASELDPQYRRQ